MKNKILFVLVTLFLMTNCGAVEENEQQQGEQQQEEQQQQQQQTPEEGVVSVWKLHEEMTSEMGDEVREGTITFYDDATLRVEDGVVDITYSFQYYTKGATIELTNTEMAEDMTSFVILDETDTKQIWESLTNDVKSVWTMTKQ